MSGTDWSLLTESHDALRSVVAGVPADAWGLPTPCEQWNVAQVFQHAAGDQFAYASKLTGEPGPGYDPFAPSGTLDGDASALLEPALSDTADAFAALDPDDAQVPVPLPPFTLPAAAGGGYRASWRAGRGVSSGHGCLCVLSRPDVASGRGAEGSL